METTTTVANIFLVEDGVNAVKVSPDRWYVASESVEKSRHKYSKGWHRQFGAAITVSDRKVLAAKDFNSDPIVSKPFWNPMYSRVAYGEVVQEFERWPSGGMLAACVKCVPFEDLLLLINHPSEKVRELVKKRYIRNK